MKLKRLHNAWRGLLGKLLSSIFSVRTKRLMCLASLSAYMKGTTAFDADTAAKLNKLMALCSDERAMKLPVGLSHAIWYGTDGNRLIPTDVLNNDIIRQHNQVQINVAVAAILAAMPRWMRYGKDEEIAEDVEKLLDASPVFLGVS